MNISSASFVKGVVGPDEILENGLPHIAFIGRSNVGKSSLINTLTGHKGLARTSSFPGHTQEINVFLVNKAFYFVDLPGYGFAKASKETQGRLQQLIYWYLLDSEYQQKKVVLILDAEVGATDNDLKILHSLEERQKNIVIVANKVDKVRKSVYKQKLRQLQRIAADIPVIPFSSEQNVGVRELLNEIFKAAPGGGTNSGTGRSE